MKTTTTTPNSVTVYETSKQAARWTLVAVGTFVLFAYALLLGLVIIL
jgi:hypothetical protein